MPAASREFVVMAKPAGALCNLDCAYCYYLEKARLYPPGERFRMPEAVLERYIAQHIEASPGPAVLFVWHGGEPTLLGLDYFRTVVALQRRHRPAGRRVINNLQTNGTLLDEAWARFLAAEGFLVGLSLDGPAELHDRYRVTRGHRPTHAQALRAWRLLQRHRVPCDLLCAVHDQNVYAPVAVYRFFRDLGARGLQFLPVVRPAAGGAGPGPGSVPAEAYGAFLCAVFDEWIRNDVGRITVQVFDEALKWACGVPRSLCLVRETCGDIPVVEHNGDVYACDHFVDPAHRLGNLRDTPLADLVDGPAQRAFGQAKRDTLPRHCRECDVLELCQGGCPKDRVLRTPEGEAGLNALCAGLRRFYRHVRPHVQDMARLWRAGQPLERVMAERRAASRAVSARAGRNDPCPCGSGRKYKQCCLGRAPA
jgi:uncharacterized protein